MVTFVSSKSTVAVSTVSFPETFKTRSFAILESSKGAPSDNFKANSSIVASYLSIISLISVAFFIWSITLSLVFSSLPIQVS